MGHQRAHRYAVAEKATDLIRASASWIASTEFKTSIRKGLVPTFSVLGCEQLSWHNREYNHKYIYSVSTSSRIFFLRRFISTAPDRPCLPCHMPSLCVYICHYGMLCRCLHLHSSGMRSAEIGFRQASMGQESGGASLSHGLWLNISGAGH